MHVCRPVKNAGRQAGMHNQAEAGGSRSRHRGRSKQADRSRLSNSKEKGMTPPIVSVGHEHQHINVLHDPACIIRQEQAQAESGTGRSKSRFRCSIVVSISACRAEDPGSIPSGGVLAMCE